MEPVLDPFLARLKLYVDTEEQLLICGRCGYALAVNRSQVTSVTSLLLGRWQSTGFTADEYTGTIFEEVGTLQSNKLGSCLVIEARN